jgi:uncharacterized protein (TIGR01244 family)
MIQVDDGISVAGALGREDLTRAREAGITLVIDLREDSEPVPHGLDPRAAELLATAFGISYRRVPIGPAGPFRIAFGEIAALVRQARGRVLVVCATGRRAAAAAVAVLGRARRWTPAASADALHALGFDVAGMPPLARAVAEYVERGPVGDHVAGDGLGI